MRRCIVLLLVLLLTAATGGCASFNQGRGMFLPGQGVTEDFAVRYRCTAEVIKNAAEALNARRPSGQNYIPQVGWDACELMAHNGRPTRIDHEQTADGRYQNWWYQSNTDAHLVTLEYDPKRLRPWVVSYVGW